MASEFHNTEDRLDLKGATARELMAFNNAVGTSWEEGDVEGEFECAEEAMVASSRLRDHFNDLHERASKWANDVEEKLPD